MKLQKRGDRSRRRVKWEEYRVESVGRLEGMLRVGGKAGRGGITEERRVGGGRREGSRMKKLELEEKSVERLEEKLDKLVGRERDVEKRGKKKKRVVKKKRV